LHILNGGDQMTVLVKNEALCIGCGACEEACSKAFFKVVDKEKSCIRVFPEGEGFKLITCTQCGVCAGECQVQALNADAKGIIRMNKKDCVGCLICVGYCPEEAMMQHDDLLEPFKCIACGLCTKACPTNAITIQTN